MPSRSSSQWAYVRTTVLFIAGLVGVMYEAALWGLSNRTPDPTLSLLFAAMMGISVTTWPGKEGEK